MSDQAMPGFPERVERAVAGANKLAAELTRSGSSRADVTTSPEYQELVRLKVILEVETSRTLSETAQICSEMERTGPATKELGTVEEER
jgi:hypothetical protein